MDPSDESQRASLWFSIRRARPDGSEQGTDVAAQPGCAPRIPVAHRIVAARLRNFD
jgi:hypothetical protein